MTSSRDEILSLFEGGKPSSTPAFSGLIHVTVEGLLSAGLSLNEVHHDPDKMARAAASTFHLTGMPSAALPLDLCAPAEALGAGITYYEGGEPQFPQVTKAWVGSTKEIPAGLDHREVLHRGRIGLICDAIAKVKADIGHQAVVSGTIPGPYTLLLYLCNPAALFTEMKREPQVVIDALLLLSSFLANIGVAYRSAGADLITVHEMGGSPGFIGPAKFEQFVLPALKVLHAKLPGPRVLSVCGNTNRSVRAMAEAGADAISVDQLADLPTMREGLKDMLLFGNLDPVATLRRGDIIQVQEAVHRVKEAGVDAVWPGCDLVPDTPIRNLRTFIAV
jgi:[methyl-Co(III) methanol-specific corrinoid protein]:coenzyme M methyltransferase